MSLHSEIFEQPQVMGQMIATQRQRFEALAEKIHKRNPKYVFIAARGTSDNAARYANYLWGAYNRMALALAAPSLFTFYQKPPVFHDALVIGISQSGKSPDIVAVLEEGKKQNCMTLALTNAPQSPLANMADAVVDLQAGPEKAVAATKTYTAELMAVAMLSVALDPTPERWAALARVPEWAHQVLSQNEKIAAWAQRYTFMSRCVVLARGYNYATAFEWSLKLKELTYTIAEPYSSADFLHGPIAMVDRGFPVLAVVPQGMVYENMLELLQKLKKVHQAELVIISNGESALSLANTPISIPADVPEWLSPLISILPAQLFAYHLTAARGYDTESPRTIQKVTETH
jgi:glucosamine--fructose-6-phosphate aminotransferase (isomerizing)